MNKETEGKRSFPSILSTSANELALLVASKDSATREKTRTRLGHPGLPSRPFATLISIHTFGVEPGQVTMGPLGKGPLDLVSCSLSKTIGMGEGGFYCVCL